MQKLVVWNRKRLFKPLFVGTSLLLLLIFALMACSTNGASAAAALTIGSTAQTTLPTAQADARFCPEKVGDPSYWNHIIGVHGDAKVELVTCGKIMQYPGTQALITVRHHSQGSLLDVYVYANILDKQPTQFFHLLDLYKGEAKISGYNTVLTAQVDLNSSINNGKPNTQLTLDLFREFKWSDGAGAFEQTFFPGMYPDLTRYQAEADQAQVNRGHDPWKLDAGKVSQLFATALFGRGLNTPIQIVSGGGLHDRQAVVIVSPNTPGVIPTTVTLSRLEGNRNGGIWEVVAAQARNFAITSPQSGALITNPVTVTGTGPSFEGIVGAVDILDHLYNKIGSASATVLNLGVPFTVNVTYTSTFYSGTQEGIIALYSDNVSGAGASPVMVKALISA